MVNSKSEECSFLFIKELLMQKHSHFSHYFVISKLSELDLLARFASIRQLGEGARVGDLLLDGSREEICGAGLGILATSRDVLNIV